MVTRVECERVKEQSAAHGLVGVMWKAVAAWCGVARHFYGCGVRVLVICDLLLIHESSYTTSAIKQYNTTPGGCEHPTYQQRARTHLYAVGQDADYATSACVGKYTAIPPARRATHSIE